MTGLPKQVEEAAELAEQYLEDLNKGSEDETTDEAVSDEPENEAVNEDDTSDADTQEDEDDEDVEETDEDKDDEEETYQRRYETLLGKYNAEVPRLHDELKELKENIFGKIDEIAKEKNEQPEPDKSAEEQSKRLEKLKEEYDADFIDTLLDVIRDEIAPTVESSVKTVEERVDSVEEAQISAAQDEFVSYLDKHIDSGSSNIGWKEAWAGEDPKFIEFLEKPEPSGLYTYGQLVKMYNESWNAEGLSKIFNIYYESSKPQKKEKETKKQKSPEEEAMIAPTRDTQHTTPDTSEGRIWTQQDIEEFKRKDRQGKYSPEESKELWDDLLAALTQNRIR